MNECAEDVTVFSLFFFIFASFLTALSEQMSRATGKMSSKITWKWLNFTVQYFIIFSWQTTNHYYVQIIGNATSTFYIQKFHFTFRVYCCLFLFHCQWMCGCALRTKKKQIRSLVINAICETSAHERFFHAKFQALCLLCIYISKSIHLYNVPM